MGGFGSSHGHLHARAEISRSIIHFVVPSGIHVDILLCTISVTSRSSGAGMVIHRKSV